MPRRQLQKQSAAIAPDVEIQIPVFFSLSILHGSLILLYHLSINTVERPSISKVVWGDLDQGQFLNFRIKHLQTKKQWIIFIGSNAIFVVLFYILWYTENPRPYTNMAYFIVMGVVAGSAINRERIGCKIIGPAPWRTTLLYSLLMVVFFGITLAGYHLIEGGTVPLNIDSQRWIYFTQPWRMINRLVSFAGIVLVVVALELYYRVYAVGLLGRVVSKQKALMIASFASALRGLVSGPVAGLYDFSLSYLWGLIYLKSGLVPALIVHLVWDILFIYAGPG